MEGSETRHMDIDLIESTLGFCTTYGGHEDFSDQFLGGNTEQHSRDQAAQTVEDERRRIREVGRVFDGSQFMSLMVDRDSTYPLVNIQKAIENGHL